MPSIHSALQRCGGGRSAYPLRNRPGILFGAICTDSAEPALAAAILDVSGAFAGEAIRCLILFAVRPRHRASEARGTSGQVRKAIFPLLLPPVCGAALRVGPKRQLRALEVALGCEPPALAP